MSTNKNSSASPLRKASLSNAGLLCRPRRPGWFEMSAPLCRRRRPATRAHRIVPGIPLGALVLAMAASSGAAAAAPEPLYGFSAGGSEAQRKLEAAGTPGPKARNATAWAVASLTSEGPGQPPPQQMSQAL
jgi:hypothetical protein